MASTSSTQIPTSVSSSSAPTCWDVFLSFRGPDTRTGLIAYLYDTLDRYAFRTFMDDPELHNGEFISSTLLEAIQNSNTYIIVLSKDYASSTWCLDELVEILQCSRKYERLIIPVFYEINPSDVRHLKGSFQTAFQKHGKRLVGQMQKVKNSRQTTLVDILKCVREFGKYKNWRQALHAVAGISGQHHVQTKSVVVTIKKVVDDILRNINPMALEVAKYPIGLDSHVAEITPWLTRDIRAIRYVGIWGKGGVGKTTLAIAVFNVNCRNFEGSCFLANVSEAFGQPKGPEGLQGQLIADVLKIKRDTITIDSVYQGKELIKKRLCSKKILIVVDDVNDQQQLDTLLVESFAPRSVIILTTRQKDLLVGVGVKATYQYMLKELDDADSRKLFKRHAFGDENPSNELRLLSSEILEHAGGLPLALVIFGSNLRNKPEAEWRRLICEWKEVVNPTIMKKLVISFQLLVSPKLKEMFLDIACFFVGSERNGSVPILGSCYKEVDANIDCLISRSLLEIDKKDRFWMHDLVRDMGWEISRQFSGKDELEKHIRIFGWKDISEVLDDNFEGGKAIQCMLYGNHNYGDHDKATYNTESFKRMPKLRFLKLTGVNLAGSFEHIFKKLRWFQWNGCPLKTLPPDFHPKELVILELYRSKITRWNLTEDLRNLKIIDLSSSENLITSPDFSRFPCLEKIDLSRCSRLEKVEFGDLKNLISLNLNYCHSLRCLPDSVCKLTALKSLDVGQCKSLESLPEKLGNMKSLTSLVMGSPRITKLPDSIIHLTNLVQLDLDGYPSSSILDRLPDLSNFKLLKRLELSNYRLLKRLSNLSNLKFLKTLKLTDCYSLTEIEGLEGLTSITEFHMTGTSMKRLSNLSNMKILETLKLCECTSLAAIEGLEGLASITKLVLDDCTSMERLPNLSNMKILKTLRLRSCNRLTEIEGLEGLASITKLVLDDCTSMKRLPNLSNLKQLEKLKLINCNMTEIEGLEGLASITELVLDLCTSIKRLPNLSNLKQLETLHLTDCSGLTEIEGLEGLASITKLVLDGCTSMERLLNLSNLKILKTLKLRNCSSLTEIEGLEGLTSITEVDMRGCHQPVVANTLTSSLFQRYSEFGNQIEIIVDRLDTPNWTVGHTEVSINYLSHNFLGLLLYVNCPVLDEENKYEDTHLYSYTINDETTYCGRLLEGSNSMMVIVPREYLIAPSVSCDDHILSRVAAYCRFDHGQRRYTEIRVHPLYKLQKTSYANTSTSSITERQRVI